MIRIAIGHLDASFKPREGTDSKADESANTRVQRKRPAVVLQFEARTLKDLLESLALRWGGGPGALWNRGDAARGLKPRKF